VVPALGLVRGEDGLVRCWWSVEDALYRRYHDEEWGRPVADDRRLFEKVCLEGFQAGLSWLTILRKREAFRRAFDGFDFEAVARFDRRRIQRLLADAGIVRHRGKIESAVHNAGRALVLREEFGSLAAYFWRWSPPLGARPRRLTLAVLKTLATTPESLALSKDLRKRGWTFVGPTTMYAFMQAVGLVNDHLEGCPARGRVEEARRAFSVPVPLPGVAASPAAPVPAPSGEVRRGGGGRVGRRRGR
jgi:DNA-3-methyladenine glycosylase I